MCGICGIVTRSPDGPDPGTIRAMCDVLRHRGPDDEGIVMSGRAGIGARRLSIIDVAGGHQPVANEDDTVWAALNGEIYNHPELIARLRARGHRFRTHCDTEVIVHLYEEYGPAFVDNLDGMFGIVVWDSSTDTLLLARDRLGIKPLYYADLGDRLIFGSELKSLLMGGLPRTLDLAALDAYLTLSYVPAPYSIFQDARKLLPGHVLFYQSGETRVSSYWRLPQPAPVDGRGAASVDELSQQLLTLLRQAVKRHLISDVPLGAFLSGGLDSSTVVALMAEEATGPVRTFSVGFAEESFDETPQARRVAQAFATDHHELVQRAEPAVLVEKIAWMCDEPFADSSIIATHSVADLAREHVKVALTGDGGDEIFGGYLLYRADKLAGLYRRLPGPARDRVIPRLVTLLPASEAKVSLDFKLKRFVRAASLPPDAAHLGWKAIFTHDARRELLGESPDGDVALTLARSHFWEPERASLIDRALFLDACMGMPDDMLTKVDRATMAVSLEARVPLLDRAVVEFMASLPSSYKVHGWQLKYLFKRAVSGLLPGELLKRRKEGFNVPIARWLRRDLRDLVTDALSRDRLQTIGVLNPAAVESLIRQHLDGRADRGREVWTLVMFGLWHARYMGGAAPPRDEPSQAAASPVPVG
jgi:asparagine synthase (glutamine-hydrolysing)